MVIPFLCSSLILRTSIRSSTYKHNLYSFSTKLNGVNTMNDALFISEFISKCQHLVCLGGAGVSTQSGIPDYRGPMGSYSKGHKPMMHSEFLSSELSRQRYWARSTIGWQYFHNSVPNNAHYALARLEQKNILQYTITQNVDRLHQKAGAINVLDLHGRNDIAKCIDCQKLFTRSIIQKQILLLNPDFDYQLYGEQHVERLRADGDAELNATDISNFRIPCCSSCGGVLKPDVVFFGDNVPPYRVETSLAQMEKADGLLVVGTSLEVYSAYRLVSRASTRKIPIVIVNSGETRAERSGLDIAYKSEQNCATLLKDVVDQLLL
eukprot:gene4558-9047_t